MVKLFVMFLINFFSFLVEWNNWRVNVTFSIPLFLCLCLLCLNVISMKRIFRNEGNWWVNYIFIFTLQGLFCDSEWLILGVAISMVGSIRWGAIILMVRAVSSVPLVALVITSGSEGVVRFIFFWVSLGVIFVVWFFGVAKCKGISSWLIIPVILFINEFFRLVKSKVSKCVDREESEDKDEKLDLSYFLFEVLDSLWVIFTVKLFLSV